MLRKQTKVANKASPAPKVAKKTLGKKKAALKVQKRNKSMSIMQAFTGKSNTHYTNMTNVHAKAPRVTESTEKLITNPEAKFATLKNGMKVVTIESQIPTTSIALSIDVGSRYENQSEGQGGLTNFMERAMLRSTTNRVTGTLYRDMQKFGAQLSTVSGRENLMFTANTPTRVNPVLGAMADVVKAAAYDFIDISQDIIHYMDDIHHRENFHPESLMDEVLHQAAFGNIGLGQAVYMTEHTMAEMKPSQLRNWHNSFMVAKRMTLSAVGVEHDSFVRLADEMFGGIAAETVKIENEPTQYYGGNLRLQDPHHHGPTHLSFAWNAPSLKSNDILTTNVVNQILGGSQPSSRLNNFNVKGLHSAQSFLQSYTDSGLVGVYATVDANSVQAYAANILGEVAGLADTVTDEQVSKAKTALKTQFYSTALGSPELQAQDMARQLQVFGEYKTPKLIQQIDAITTADVKKVAKNIFRSDLPITVASLGDVTQLPREISIE